MILHTTTVGEGKPILFLHTGLQTGMLDFVYQRNYFKGNYQVILPDLRGHGLSKVDGIDILTYIEDTAEDLLETLDHLAINHAHIAGASLGALIGLVFTKKYPERVVSLTLSGIVPEKPENWTDLQVEDLKMQMAVLKNEEAVNYFNSIHESDWENFLRKTQKVEWYPFHETEDISTIQCPVLYIVGEEKKHEVLGIQKYSNMIKDIHVAVFPFAAHLVHSEQPEIYSMILEQFIEKHKSGCC